MDRQLLERMIGAGVLIVALILIVPAILDGQRNTDPETDAAPDSGTPSGNDEPTRTHTMVLDRPPESPPVAREKTPAPADELIEAPQQQDPAATPKASSPPETPKPEKSAKETEQASSKESTSAEPPEEITPAQTAVSEPPAKTDRPPKQDLYQVPESGWAVQIGSFAAQQNAERLAKTISKNGFSAYLMPLQRSGQTLYRVRVGPRDSRVQASELADRLAKAGYKGQVIEQRPDS